jgi:hypothetical protein
MIRLLSHIVDILVSLSVWLVVIIVPFLWVDIIPNEWVPSIFHKHAQFFKYMAALVGTILMEAFLFSPIWLLMEMRQLLREISKNTK